MYAYGQELISAKRAEPTDDMLSVVANTTVDEDGLSEIELYLFFSLLFSAGAACACRPSRSARVVAHRPVAVADRRRGDGALDITVTVEASHRHARRRVGWMRHRGRLLGRFSSARVVKPVEWTRSNRHTGIRHLIVELEA
jgi:hypothetical protein